MLYGLASPPTSYGGYGGNNKDETPKYAFEYPKAWRKDSIGKNDKGTIGIDSRVVNVNNPKGERAFVIVFGRAGEDDASYEVNDPEKALTGFSLADPDLSNALESASNVTSGQRDQNGRTFFDYDI